MTRRSPLRPARVAALAVVAFGWGLALGPASPAAAVDPSPAPSTSASAETELQLATFGVTGASGDVPDTRSYLAMTAAPGSVVYDSVAVINQSDVPLDIDVYTGDAINTDDGSVGLPDRSVTPTAAGTWLTVGASTVNVPAQSSTGRGYTVVPVTITIPADAEPGEHLAGVIVSITAQGTAAGEDKAATVNLEQRVGLRVYVTVDGPIHAGLTVTGVRSEYNQAGAFGLAGAGSATVTYTLTNTGNTRLMVQPTTTATGLFGQVQTSADGDRIDELLPGASVTQTVELSRVLPLVFHDIVVSASVSAPLSGTDPGIGTPAAQVSMWAVPWAYLAVIVLAAVVWWLLRRMRKRRISRGRHSHGPVASGSAARRSGEQQSVSPHTTDQQAPQQLSSSQSS